MTDLARVGELLSQAVYGGRPGGEVSLAMPAPAPLTPEEIETRHRDGHTTWLPNGPDRTCDVCVLLAAVATRDTTIRALGEALTLAHACGTLRDDGSCDGCPVSDALARVPRG